MSGQFTQALANLSSEEAHITGLSGLPSAARSIQAGSKQIIQSTLTTLTDAQTKAKSFAASALSDLDDAVSMLNGDSPLDAIADKLNGMAANAKALVNTFDRASQVTTHSANEIAGFQNQLAAIESGLNSQKAQLVAEQNEARDKAEAAKKKRWYWLALGPFGIAGAAAALALFIKESNEASDLESKANALNAEIGRQVSLVNASKQLGTDFVTLSSKVLLVKNAADIVQSDISEILSDVNEKGARLALTLHIKAAITEVNTLEQDVA